MIIRLTQGEVAIAAQVGIIRRIEQAGSGAKTSYGSNRKLVNWNSEVIGALGECAVAKYFGLYWSGATVLGALDVGRYEVRTTDHPKGRLIVHDEDRSDAPFVLVCVKSVFKYQIQGWLLGKKCKDKRYWTDPGTGRPAYFVPVEALASIETLKPTVVSSRVAKGSIL